MCYSYKFCSCASKDSLINSSLLLQEYLDDESTLQESSQIGSFTEEKWEQLGTREAVVKSRTQIAHRSPQQMAGKLL